MKKNDIVTFTAPNGVEVTGIAIELLYTKNNYGLHIYHWLCYAQNRLLILKESNNITDDFGIDFTVLEQIKVLVDYAVLPDYDSILEEYFHQHDLANDYADKEL